MKPILTNPLNVNKHIAFLDGFRGIAISLVLLYHCFLDFTPARIGWIGVDIFFVLSGFLITGILLKTKDSPHYFKNFFIRRALRIFPLYYLFLIIIFIVLPIFGSSLLGDMSNYKDNQIWYWTYLQNWLLSFEGFPENYSLHHLWSLAVEEQFYLIWPVIIFFTPVKKLIPVICILIFLSFVFRMKAYQFGLIFPYSYVNTFSRMDTLLLGGLVYILNRDHKEWLKKYAFYILLLSSSIVIGFIAFKKSLYFWNLHYIYTFIGISIATFLSILCSEGTMTHKLRMFFQNYFLRWLGKYSYGIYLFHYPLLFILTSLLLPGLNNTFHQVLLAKFLVGCICIIISCLLAYCSFHIIEKRFLNLKEKLAKH